MGTPDDVPKFLRLLLFQIVLLYSFKSTQGQNETTTVSTACDNEGETVMLPDCYEYLCENNEWVKTGQSNSSCCNYTPWEFTYYWYLATYLYYGSYGLNTTIQHGSCGEYVCSPYGIWKQRRFNNATCCQYANQYYEMGDSIYHDDCFLYTCSDGIWSPTGVSDNYCCYYHESYHFWPLVDVNQVNDDCDYYDFYEAYYGPGGTVVAPNCTVMKCVSRSTMIFTDINITLSNVCKYQYHVYSQDTIMLHADCYEYLCNGSVWVKTGQTHPSCCFYFNSEVVYSPYNGYHGLNATAPLDRCREYVCTRSGIWDVKKLDDCCDYKGNYYETSESSYQDDCFKYECTEGAWFKTNVTDEFCCAYGYYSEFYWPFYYHYGGGQECYYYGSYEGYHDLLEKIVFPNCTEAVCVERNTWKITDLNLTDHRACLYNGFWYSSNATHYDYDCYEYICFDGQWIKSGKTSPECCWYYPWNSQYYWDGRHHLYFGKYTLNDTVPEGNCTELVCVAPSVWQRRMSNDTDCCEYQGEYYEVGDWIYKEDCHKYVCSESIWVRTDASDPNCCFYHYWWYVEWVGESGGILAHDCYLYGSSDNYYGYYGPNEKVVLPNCTEIECTKYYKWEITEVNAIGDEDCLLSGYWYTVNQTYFESDCYEYICLDGQWMKSSNTNPDCCFYQPWYSEYYWDGQHHLYYGYHNLYATIPHGSCFELVCVASWSWHMRSINNSDCCIYEGNEYETGDMVMQNDCFLYNCGHGTWTRANITDQYCCSYHYWTFYYMNIVDNIALNHDCLYYGPFDGYLAPETRIILPNCTEIMCIGYQKFNVTDMNIIGPEDCEFGGQWYPTNATVYMDDCYKHVCHYGDWVKTDETDPNCCLYMAWWTDYYYTGGKLYRGYFDLNFTIPQGKCNELICVARNNWQYREANNTGCCEYKGSLYGPDDIGFKDDCTQYVCIDGLWNKTNNTDPYCCSYNWWVYYDWIMASGGVLAQECVNYRMYEGFVGLEDKVVLPNCTEVSCIGLFTWEMTNLNGTVPGDCTREGYWYSEQSIVYEADCYGYICNQGQWVKTDLGNPDCCRYNPWWYQYYFDGIHHLYYGNYGPNDTVPHGKCSELVCVAQNWERRELNNTDCCEHDGGFYEPGDMVFGGNCYKNICEHGKWIPTNISDQHCCRYDNSNFDDWYSSNNGDYDKECFHYTSYGDFGINAKLILPNCTELVCTGLSNWEVSDLNITQNGACTYNRYWYKANSTIYMDDCNEYVCNGDWIKTNTKRPFCCEYQAWSYEYNEYYLYHGNHDLNAAVPRSNCSELICVALGSWQERKINHSDCCEYEGHYYKTGDLIVMDAEYKCEDEIWTPTNRTQSPSCLQDGLWYQENSTRYDDDCLEHTCFNSSWVLTYNTDPHCCWYTEWFIEERPQDDMIQPIYGLNETVMRRNCRQDVCIRRNTWQDREMDGSLCCEHNGAFFSPGDTVMKGDCYEYICNNSEWTKTNVTNQKCCWFESWWTEYYWQGDFYKYFGSFALNAVIPINNCSGYVCLSQELWAILEFNNTECCEFEGELYDPGDSVYKQNCHKHICKEGTWIQTNITDKNCCWYADWEYYEFMTTFGYPDTDECVLYYDRKQGYYGPHEKLVLYNCVEIVCTEYSTWNISELNITSDKDCMYGGRWHKENTSYYVNDCYAYICNNGSAVKTDQTDPECCMYYPPESEYYWNDLYKYYGYHTLNETIPESSCTEIVCTSLDKWVSRKANNSSCCEYEGLFYDSGDFVYKKDCYRYLCNESKWHITNITDQFCCLFDSWSSFYEFYINSGIPYSDPCRTYGDSVGYYKLLENVVLPNCTIVQCIGNSKWEAINRSVEENGACILDGLWYKEDYAYYASDCYETTCKNGSWISSGKSHPACCIYQPWYSEFYWIGDYYKYYGSYAINETVPYGKCLEVVCGSYGIWTERGLESSDCCEHKGVFYEDGDFVFMDDCYQYVCNESIWMITYIIDEFCCYYNTWDNYYSWYYDQDLTYSSECNYYGSYSGFYGLLDTVVLPNCTEIACVGHNTWNYTNLTISFDRACDLNGYWYEPNVTIQHSDCYEYTCIDGQWIQNGITYSCCWYYPWDSEYYWYGDHYKYFRIYAINETVPQGNCAEIVCTARDVWQRREINNTGCCEYKGSLYSTGQVVQKDDCFQYTCNESLWMKSGVDQYCCWYDSWSTYYYWYAENGMEYKEECKHYGTYISYNGYFGPQSYIVLPNCTEIVCVGYSTWQVSDMNATRDQDCSYDGFWYMDNSTFAAACQEFSCNNGSLVKNETIPFCCKYYPPGYQYYWNEVLRQERGGYYENETIPFDQCLELVCVAPGIWEVKYFNNTCCELNGYFYPIGSYEYKADCYLHYCLNGEWIKTTQATGYCCYYQPWLYEYYWYTDSYMKYGWYGPGAVITQGPCSEIMCIDSQNLTERSLNNEECCEYGGNYYTESGSAYQNDCFEHICMKGEWHKTNITNQYCCRYDNGDYIRVDDTSSPDDLESCANENYYGNFGLQEKITLPNCTELECTGYNIWKYTQTVERPGCTLGGKNYRNGGRFPGCFMVYCREGKWEYVDRISNRCKHCYGHWDPHFWTFDGHYYHYFGTEEYAITQIGTSRHPQSAIFSNFLPCYGLASCIDGSTYKDNPNTVIKMGADGLYPPVSYTMYVNNVPFVVNDTNPRTVMEGNISHPVLAWTDGNCIYLIGSCGLSMLKCGYDFGVYIWALPELSGQLYGLCGFFDGNVTNDFTTRDLTIAELLEYPPGTSFPDSWQVSGTVSTTNEQVLPEKCTLDDSEQPLVGGMCEPIKEITKDILPAERTEALMVSCEFDLCTIYRNSSGNMTTVNEWMGGILKSAEIATSDYNKTTEDDDFPTTFSLTSTSTVSTTTVPITTPKRKRKCRLGFCKVNIEIVVEMYSS